MFKKTKIFIVVGGPGSGKKTQARMLTDYLLKDNPAINVGCYDNGESLRNATCDPKFTHYAKFLLSKSINTLGETVPGAITVNRWVQFLLENDYDNKHLVLQGMFRTPHEPDLFVEFTDKFFTGVPKYFIRLNVSDKVMLERLENRKDVNEVERSDDKDEKTRENRINVYKKSNLIYDKVVENPNFISLDIDGEQSPEEVRTEIKSRIVATESFRTDKDVFKGESPFCPR